MSEGNRGRFPKGVSGNPRGRPGRGDSLAEQIRKALTKRRRKALLDRMCDLACEPHGDTHARIKAAEWLAKHGWPDEAKMQVAAEVQVVQPLDIFYDSEAPPPSATVGYLSLEPGPTR